MNASVSQMWTSPEHRTWSQREARSALRRVDVAKIEKMLSEGWDPNRPFDAEGNGAVNLLLEVCEWNPGHDQQELLLAARALFDGGAKLDRRNVWGDMPYSIAKADRYCGPNHPVTIAIRNLCTSGDGKVPDSCLASYETSKVN